MTVPDDRDRPGPERNPTHEAHLALCKTQKERVRYACEILARPRPESADVLDFLELYGYINNRKNQTANVRTLVSKWRAEHGMADTGGTIPSMTPEMLDLLDQRAAASETADANPRPRPLRVVRESATSEDTEVREPASEDANQVREPEFAPANPAPEVREPAPATNDDPAPAVMPAESSPAAPAEGTAASPKKRRAPLFLGLISMVAMGVSADTSLRFFGERLHVPDPYRFLLFAVMELGLLACALSMFEGVRDHGRPGPLRFVAWGICAVSGFAALELSGPLDGPLRTLLGPVLALIFLHAALGIEIRATRARTTAWSRIGREFRERFLSRLGLGDDSRDAVTRTRERAAVRLAYLATARFVPFRTARMRRAGRIANIAHDSVMKDRAEREHHSVQQLAHLKEVQHGSFWNGR